MSDLLAPWHSTPDCLTILHNYSALAADPRTKVVCLLPIRNVGGVSLVRLSCRTVF
jgi:hypothetical protein